MMRKPVLMYQSVRLRSMSMCSARRVDHLLAAHSMWVARLLMDFSFHIGCSPVTTYIRNKHRDGGRGIPMHAHACGTCTIHCRVVRGTLDASSGEGHDTYTKAFGRMHRSVNRFLCLHFHVNILVSTERVFASGSHLRTVAVNRAIHIDFK